MNVFRTRHHTKLPELPVTRNVLVHSNIYQQYICRLKFGVTGVCILLVTKLLELLVTSPIYLPNVSSYHAISNNRTV